HTFWNLHRHLKRKPDEDIFQQILSVDTGAAKREPPTIEVIDLNTPTLEQPEPELRLFDGTTEAVDVTEQAPQDMEAADAEAEAERLRTEQEIDTIIDEKVRELEQLELEQQMAAPEPHQLTANDKINEWMKSNELQEQPHEPSPSPAEVEADDSDATEATVETQVATTEEDKTLNELLEQVAELDEIYTDFVMQRDTYNNTLQNELQSMDRPPMQVDDSFDDAATYTSLQIAYKHPVDIPMEDIMPPTPPMSQCAPEDAQHYDAVEVNSQQERTQEPQERTQERKQLELAAAQLLSASEEEKLPPLPPKRLRKQDSNAENRSIEANNGDAAPPAVREKARGLPPPIIHPRISELPTAPTKRLPQPPETKSKSKSTTNPNFNTLPRQKKPGFFSKLFSRRKSKPELMQQSSENCSKATSAAASREPSLDNLNMRDPLRASQRSSKSNQTASSGPLKSGAARKIGKAGKPCGRSVSSVSGKRPSYLNADVVHIPLKGDSTSSLQQAPHEAYSNASTITVGGQLDRRTASALQLAEIPISEGGMELVAIADRQSLHNLVSSIEAHFNVKMDPNLDLTEVEHFALYTSVPPQATASEFDETSAYYAQVDAGEILTPDQVAKRLAAANGN
ncbi:uncharacterized protein Dvir_GJ26245, partial [Drosophila virilis]